MNGTKGLRLLEYMHISCTERDFSLPKHNKKKSPFEWFFWHQNEVFHLEEIEKEKLNIHHTIMPLDYSPVSNALHSIDGIFETFHSNESESVQFDYFYPFLDIAAQWPRSVRAQQLQVFQYSNGIPKSLRVGVRSNEYNSKYKKKIVCQISGTAQANVLVTVPHKYTHNWRSS